MQRPGLEHLGEAGLARAFGRREGVQSRPGVRQADDRAVEQDHQEAVEPTQEGPVMRDRHHGSVESVQGLLECLA